MTQGVVDMFEYLKWFGIAVVCLGFWTCGSAFVAAYLERHRHENGNSNYEWFDDAPGIILVIFWPIAVPLVAPFYGAHKLGSVVYNRIHMTELIQDELKGDSDHDHPPMYDPTYDIYGNLVGKQK